MIFLVHIRFRLNIHASTKKLDFLDKRTSDESTLNVLKVNCKKKQTNNKTSDDRETPSS